MRFSPPPLPRSLPFLCLHVFIRVCIRLRGRRQKERERRRGEEREGNSLFSPSPSPALSPLCACHEDQICIYETIVKTWLYFLHIFNRSISWEINRPPPTHTHTHTHFQTPFQRNLLTSSGIRRREISREQFPTPELLVEWLQPLGAVISWIVWVIKGQLLLWDGWYKGNHWPIIGKAFPSKLSQKLLRRKLVPYP